MSGCSTAPSISSTQSAVISSPETVFSSAPCFMPGARIFRRNAPRLYAPCQHCSSLVSSAPCASPVAFELCASQPVYLPARLLNFQALGPPLYSCCQWVCVASFVAVRQALNPNKQACYGASGTVAPQHCAAAACTLCVQQRSGTTQRVMKVQQHCTLLRPRGPSSWAHSERATVTLHSPASGGALLPGKAHHPPQ